MGNSPCVQKQEGGWGSLFLHMRIDLIAQPPRGDEETLQRKMVSFQPPKQLVHGKWIAVYNIKAYSCVYVTSKRKHEFCC